MNGRLLLTNCTESMKISRCTYKSACKVYLLFIIWAQSVKLLSFSYIAANMYCIWVSACFMFAQADAVQICSNIRSTRYIEWVCNRLCNVYKNTIKIILNFYWWEKLQIRIRIHWLYLVLVFCKVWSVFCLITWLRIQIRITERERKKS